MGATYLFDTKGFIFKAFPTQAAYTRRSADRAGGPCQLPTAESDEQLEGSGKVLLHYLFLAPDPCGGLIGIYRRRREGKALRCLGKFR